MIFLTDGRTFLGPYRPEEVSARIFGERWLREVHHAPVIYRLEADTDAGARRAYRQRTK